MIHTADIILFDNKQNIINHKHKRNSAIAKDDELNKVWPRF